MIQEPNPYESPQTTGKPPNGRLLKWVEILEHRFPKIFNLRGKMLLVWWAIIFAVNLIIPGVLAAEVACGYSQFGIYISCLVLFLFGVYLCVNLRRYSEAMVLGGAVIGVTQFLPIVQLTAGAIAFSFLKGLGFTELQQNQIPYLFQFSEGFLLTFITGLELMASSLIIGLWGTRRERKVQR